jgi:energy-coupling factor transport system permease protein
MLDQNRFLIGMFRPGQGWLYRLDARTKILWVFLVMVAAILSTSIVFYLALIAALLLLLTSCRLGYRVILANMKPVAWFVAFTALFHLLFSGRGDPQIVADFSFVRITSTAVMMALVYSARILIFVLATFVLSLTTSPLSLSEAVVALLKPFRLLKLPVDDLGMVLFIALRFIPVLAYELDTIRKAQFIRGVTFSGPVWRRVRRSVALVLPVFFSALRRADDLSVAIATRGYRSGQPRSSLYPLRFRRLDYVVLTASIVLLAVGVLGSRPA